jgi:hypothetical protein
MSMSAPKGHKKYTGSGGSRKGKPNKFTQSAKEAFQLAFDELGGAKGLAKWAKGNQGEFYKLYSKLIPVDVTSGGEALKAGTVIINGETITHA